MNDYIYIAIQHIHVCYKLKVLIDLQMFCIPWMLENFPISLIK